MEIKAIFFDYGGTLDAEGVAWKERFYPLYRKHGVDVNVDKFSRAFYASDDSLLVEKPVDMNLTEIVHEQVERVLKELGYFTTGLQKAIAADFINDSFATIHKNAAFLNRLKKHFAIGIVSNNYGNLEAICRETGLSEVTDVLVDSNIVGTEKPHARIFWKALHALKVSPAQAIMVGDNVKRDILGALNVGMKAVLLSRGGLLEGIAIPPPVPVIGRLEELARIVGPGE